MVRPSNQPGATHSREGDATPTRFRRFALAVVASAALLVPLPALAPGLGFRDPSTRTTPACAPTPSRRICAPC
jgi:hypothetical protein